MTRVDALIRTQFGDKLGTTATLTFSDLKQTQQSRPGTTGFGGSSFGFNAQPAAQPIATSLKASDLDTQGALLRIHHVDGKGIETVAAPKGFLERSRAMFVAGDAQNQMRAAGIVRFKAPEPTATAAKAPSVGFGAFGQPGAVAQEGKAAEPLRKSLDAVEEVQFYKVERPIPENSSDLLLSFVVKPPASAEKPRVEEREKAVTAEEKVAQQTLNSSAKSAAVQSQKPDTKQEPELPLFEKLRKKALQLLIQTREIAGRN